MRKEDQIEVELEPELNACVETKARQEYQAILKRLLKRDSDMRLKTELEMLRLFLETTDFKKLREKYEKHLAAGERARFILRPGKNQPAYEIKIGQAKSL